MKLTITKLWISAVIGIAFTSLYLQTPSTFSLVFCGSLMGATIQALVIGDKL